MIDTSTGLGDIRPWPDVTDGAGSTDGAAHVARAQDAEDECILLFQRVRDADAVRHVSVDGSNNVWVGGYPFAQRSFHRLDGADGSILDSFDSRTIGCGGYGGLIDGDGTLWSAGRNNFLLRYDPSSGTGTCIGVANNYGLGIDTNGCIWNSMWTNNSIVKICPPDVIQPGFPKTTGGASSDRGVTVTTADDHVWVANSGGSNVSRLDNDGNLVAVIAVGATPTGLSVDAAGKVWVTNLDAHNVMRIDPATNLVDLTVGLGAGAGPYNYSDMTGSTLTAPPTNGTWTVVYDSGVPGAEWGFIRWNADEPGDSQVSVTAASSADGVTFSPAQAVTQNVDLTVPGGQFLKVTVNFARATTGESPVLFDLTISLEVCDLALDKTCAVLPEPVDLECQAKIAATTLRYIGPTLLGAHVEWTPKGGPPVVYAAVDLISGVTVLTKPEEDGFTIDGRPGDLGSKLTVRVNGAEEVLHTSCSTPYVAGQPAPLDKPKGDPSPHWFVVNFQDKDGLFVEVPEPEQQADACTGVLGPAPGCETEDKPHSLTFAFTGGPCSDTTNPQRGKLKCTDAGALDPGREVQVVVTKDAKKIGVEPSTVGPGERFTLSRGDGKRLGGDVKLELWQGGVPVQRLEIHTSCSKPLAAGDVFGALTLARYNGRSAGAEVVYAYTITNHGNPLADVALVDRVGGQVVFSAGPSGLDQGAMRSYSVMQMLAETTTNVATAVGTLPSGRLCEAADAVTVTLEPQATPCVWCGFGEDDADKVSRLTLAYIGSATNPAIEVYDKDKRDSDKLLFAGTPDPVDGTFGFSASAIGEDKLSSEISIWIGGVMVAGLHTSCSDVLGPGTTEQTQAKGTDPNGEADVRVVSGLDKNHQPLCPIDPLARLFGEVLPEALDLAPQHGQKEPGAFSLKLAYPNPFNPQTTIRFAVPEASPVQVVVFDVLGRRVEVLSDGLHAAGLHEVVFDASSLPSGMYLVRLETPHGSFVQTMLLVK